MYVERPRKSLLVNTVITLAIVALGVAFWFTVNSRNAPSGAFLAVGTAVVAVAYVLIAFYTMEYRITTDELQIRYPPFLYRIPKRDIRRIEVAKLPWWRGVGVKMGWHRIAFTTRYGQAMHIERKTGFFHDVWLTPDEPDAFAAKLKK
ncbi:PH domain-containing protein [Candidatus Micrarchaeota archaeon]|nr:PH domain-containing protein [Candidatus Micrarchaeota archaeon]